MENATKALLIAAAVLIAVVIITVTVFVLMNGVDQAKESADLSPTQVTTYNSKWEAYVGTKVSGSKVRQLVNDINQHNRTNTDDTSKQITITGDAIPSSEDKTKYSSSGIGAGNTYSVSIPSTGYSGVGYINTIQISK